MFGNNAGSLRLFAAFMVLWGHGFTLAVGRHSAYDPVSLILQPYTPFSLALPGLGVALFFILSGYLITASYQKNRGLLSFFAARVFRIFPALIVAVLFCVFIGGLFSSLPIGDYLQHKGTWKFLFYNSILVEGIYFKLPGVFADLPFSGGVNGSLWTLPIEFGMYIYVVLVGLLGLFSDRRVFNAFFITLILAFMAAPDTFPFLQKSGHAYLGLSFLLGAFFQINKDQLMPNYRYVWVVLTLACVWSYGSPRYAFFSLSLFAAALIYFSFYSKFQLPRFDKYGDFSYGLYLYAFPLQQACIAVIGPENPYLINFLSLLGAFFLAVLSWFYIEKPSMMLKNKLLSIRTINLTTPDSALSRR